MKRTLFIPFVIISVFLAVVPNQLSAANSQLDDYKLKHDSRILHPDIQMSDIIAGTKTGLSGSVALFDDSRINTDADPERFKHQYSSGALLSNNQTLAVWEDDRNGDYDIIGQIMAQNGSLVGDNQHLIYDDNFLSQRMIRLACSGNGKIAAAWVDENGDLYIRFYDSSFTSMSDAKLVNDNLTGNLVSYPDLTFLSDDRLVIVWEDTRLGSAIYGQIYTALNEKAGGNFQINPVESDQLFWSPGIAAGADGQFAVIWEQIRSAGSEVYLLLFDSDASPSGMPINVADLAAISADQFDPAVAPTKSSGYLVGWSDSRGVGQEILGQVFDKNGGKLSANFQVSEGENNIASELSFAYALSGKIFAVWDNVSTYPEIVGQPFDDAVVKIGGNRVISDALAFGERFSPDVIFRNDGSAMVTFSDTRTGSIQIYTQSMNADFSLSGANFKLSSAGTGAQQGESQVGRMAGGDFAVVWSDQRADEGDIYFQRCSQSGVKLGVNQKVNDDLMKAAQKEPALGTADNGRAVVAWVDTRADNGLTGTNIFAQFYAPAGTKVGGNFKVNDDPAGSNYVKAEPDGDISPSGRAVVVWRDGRNSRNDIYGQLYDPAGVASGGNFRVNQENNPCLDPAVAMINNDMFVVAWRVLIHNNSYIQFQVFNANGSFYGNNTMIPIDTALNQQLDFDLSVNPYFGIFALVWINQTEDNTEIHSLLISLDGTPMASPQIVSDFPNVGFENISVDMDAYNTYGAAWSDWRGGTKRSYVSLVDQGTTVLPNMLISRNAGTAREQEPAVALNGRYVICSWSDNRTPGAGFDIYANSELYNPTSIDDDQGLPLPRALTLSQNYPNPFNPTTRIDFALSHNIPRVEFDVFNLLGQSVYHEDILNLQAGPHSIQFDAGQLPSGVYMYRLTAGKDELSNKMLLLK